MGETYSRDQEKGTVEIARAGSKRHGSVEVAEVSEGKSVLPTGGLAQVENFQERGCCLRSFHSNEAFLGNFHLFAVSYQCCPPCLPVWRM